MITKPSTSFRRLFAVGVLALAVTACSTSGGGDDVANPSTSTTAAAGASTTEPNATEFTVADLEPLLPTAEDVDGSYEVKPNTDSSSDDDDDPLVAAIDEDCPGVSALFDDTGSAAAKVKMEDAVERSFGVELSPEPRIEADTIDDQIDAVKDCSAVTYTDEDGSDLTLELSAERTDDYGDLAVTLIADLTIENGELPAPIRVRGVEHTFLVGPISVTVNIVDGLDSDTYENAPGDIDLLDQFSVEMETRVTDLVDG